MSEQRTSSEYENFDRTMRELIKVPHSEIKAALDAEKPRNRRSKTGSLGNLPLTLGVG